MLFFLAGWPSGPTVFSSVRSTSTMQSFPHPLITTAQEQQVLTSTGVPHSPARTHVLCNPGHHRAKADLSLGCSAGVGGSTSRDGSRIH